MRNESNAIEKVWNFDDIRKNSLKGNRGVDRSVTNGISGATSAERYQATQRVQPTFSSGTFNISGIISAPLVDKARSLFKRTRAWRAASSFVAEDIGQMGLFRGQAGYLGQSSSSHPTKSLSSRPPTRRPLPLALSISIMSGNIDMPRLFELP